MPKFRKKPVVIEAVQFDGTPKSAVELFQTFNIQGAKFVPCSGLQTGFLTIPTLEGTMKATKGDFIIRGVQDEFYPCKADIFAATYEPVAEGEAA